MKKYSFKEYKIERNSPCPCGSGKKFKKCCAQYLHLSTKLHDKAINFLDLKDYASAEIYFRAFLTQYIIWYHEHTIPFYNECPNEAEFLLLVDIEAIMAIIFQIINCLYHQKKNDEIDIFLKHSENIICDPRHIFNVRSYQAFWLDYFGDTENAKALLRKSDYANLKLIADNEFGREGLLFLLKIQGLELPLVSNLDIIQAIIKGTKEEIKLVEPLSYKALISYLYLDKTSAEKFIDEAIEKIEALGNKLDCSEAYYYAVFSRAWELKGIISLSEAASRRAIEYLNSLLPLIKDEIDKLSWANTSIGHIYRFIGDFEKAYEYLQSAYDLQKTIITSLDLAHINSVVGNVEETRNLLKEIQVKEMDKYMSIDYYAVQANLVIKVGDKISARVICNELANLDISIPQLKEFKNIISNSLYEMIDKSSDADSLIKRILNGMSRCLILQPNIFGIGININEIIKSSMHNKKNRGG